MAGEPEDAAESATVPERGAARDHAPERVGRYRIQGVLGRGGMGVVYAAFDPDLERNVALKRFHPTGSADSDAEARARLLREARAMARLQHPNVVAVYEVGTADGRDYIAMELVVGTTLVQWLHAASRSPHEIVDVFLAAGRGLAAAHAQGLVHRDFKPHNVLIGDDGRVLVGDFGLARGIDAPRVDPAAATMPPGTPPPQGSERGLPEVTATGIVLGTPAYMAPEQWTGNRVGPSSDQFAFCVALWEALTGERPFRGTTDEELRDDVSRGAAARDTSKLPRALRAVLVRGLAPKPSERWPSMDDLLGRMRRAERQPVMLVALGGVAVALAAAALIISMSEHGNNAFAAHCEPAPDPTARWSADRLPAPLTSVFADELARWRTVRGAACVGAPRAAQLDCLDRVLAQLESAHHAATEHAFAPDRIYDRLVDPAVCAESSPPRIAAPAACAQAHAALDVAAATRDRVVHHDRAAVAAEAAERCGDDSAIAVAALETAWFEEAARGQAASAVARVPQADLVAWLDLIDASAAAHRGKLDRAVALADSALDELRRRGMERPPVRALLAHARLHLTRATTEDLAQVRAEVAAVAPAQRDDALELARLDGLARLLQGDVRGAHDALNRLLPPQIVADGATPLGGDVVDEHGTPVAGVQVYAAPIVFADAWGILPVDPTVLRRATTDARGHFAMAAASAPSFVVAIAGDRRSAPAALHDGVHLALAPTRSANGRVDLAPGTRRRALVGFAAAEPPGSYFVVAPVAPDGRFEIAGLASTMLMVMPQMGVIDEGPTALPGAILQAGTAPIRDLAVSANTNGREVYVIVRSAMTATFDQAMVALLAGHRTMTKLHPDASSIPVAVRVASIASAPMLPSDVTAKLRPGDLVAHFDAVPGYLLSACAVAMPENTTPLTLMANPHRSELEARCADVALDARVVVVVTPPQKRFE